MTTASGRRAAWAAIEARFGSALVADIAIVLERNDKPATRQTSDRVARVLFTWLMSIVDDPDLAGVAALYSKEPARAEGHADIQRVSLAVERWYGEMLASGDTAKTTAFGQARMAALLLQWLGELPGALYPEYRRSYHKVPKPDGNTPSLGSLPWPELDGLIGLARERKAIRLVRDAAVEEFGCYVDAFDFGQALLAADQPPPTVDAAAFNLVKSCVSSVLLLWPKRDFAGTRRYRQLVKGFAEEARLRRTWSDAGMPHRCIDLHFGVAGRIDDSALGILCMECLAPSIGSVTAFVVAFAAATSWNKQPILDLPREAVVYRTKDTVNVAGARFLSAFKNRARHHVMAHLGGGPKVSGLLEERCSRAWSEAVGEMPGHAPSQSAGDLSMDSSDSEFALLDQAAAAAIIRALDDAGRMADTARFHDPICRDAACLLVFPPLNRTTREDGLVAHRQVTLRRTRSELLQRPHLTFPAIRKSFALAHYKSAGSAAALAPLMGHASTPVLFYHYLTTADLRAELNESIRYFQATLQSLILVGRAAAPVELRLEAADIEFLARLARAAGISAALGLAPKAMAPLPTTLRFVPTDANLRELALCHWALRRAACLLPREAWKARCLPLLGAVKAIGKQVCAKGLRRTYSAAARSVLRDLASGRVALPPIEGT